MVKGLIIKAISGFYYVKTENEVIECRARGVFKKDGITPMVGDNVLVELEGKTNKGTVAEVIDRKNSLVRPPVANIGLLLMVVTMNKPKVNLNQFDKMLVTAEKNKIPVCICINKTDILNDRDINEFESIYKGTGYKQMRASALNGDGIDELKEMLVGRVAALAGNSGVGKSTILNAIRKDLSIKTNDISEKTERGRHTTRHTEIFEIFDGTYVFDTPGFSSLDIEGVKKEELAYLFPEFREYMNDCKFRGCSHKENEAGCAIVEGVRRGKISPFRHQSYTLFYNELEKIKDWENK